LPFSANAEKSPEFGGNRRSHCAQTVFGTAIALLRYIIAVQFNTKDKLHEKHKLLMINLKL
jgi:hypothetical protein